MVRAPRRPRVISTTSSRRLQAVPREPRWGSALLPALLLVASLLGCQTERDRVGPPEAPEDPFTLGPVTAYPVEAGPGGVVVDTISGGSFSFPDGASGTLTVARILASPKEPPMESDGFWVSYTGDEEIELHLPRTAEEFPLLWVYGNPGTSPFDAMTEGDTWWPVMPEDTVGTVSVFPLVAPGDPDIVHGQPRAGGAGVAHHVPAAGVDPEALAAQATGGPASILAPLPTASTPIHNYRFMRRYIRSNQPEWQTLHNLKLVTQWTIADVIAALPPHLQPFATAETTGRLALRSYGALPAPEVSAYSPFLLYRTYIGPPIRRLYPMLSYVCSGRNIANEATVAHEVGHYMNHVFFGDDAFHLFRQEQVILAHDVGDVHPKRHMLEEYAQFVDYFKNGKIRGGLDVEEPIPLFTTTPDQVDWPAQEGYPTCLLARLHTNDATIEGLSGEREPIPVIGMSFSEIFRILYEEKPTDANILRAAIAVDLSRRGQVDRLPALLERTGWSYHGEGRVVDANGDPIEDAEVQAVSKVTSGGPNEYLTPPTPVRTDLLGRFTLPRLFPGTNTIRVRTGQAVSEFVVTVDPNQSTENAIALGTLTVRENLMDQIRRMTWMRFTCDGEFLLDNGGMEVKLFYTNYDREYPVSWTGQELVWQFADSSAYGDSFFGTSLHLEATFAADGRSIVSVECHMREWQTFQGRLQHERISDIELVDLPLNNLDTTPGWARADYELFREAIDSHVRSISFVERYLDVYDITITATEFRWNGSTMPGHLFFGLRDYEK